MQSLNDDMDELFRRASEEYPLNTNTADWNKVMHKLHHTEDDLVDGDKKKRDYKYLLLLLLLPIGFITGRYFGNNNNKANLEINKKAANKEISLTAGQVHKNVARAKSAAIAGISKADNKKQIPVKTDNSDGGDNKADKITVASINGNAGKLAGSNKEVRRLITRSKAENSPKKTTVTNKDTKETFNSLLAKPANKNTGDKEVGNEPVAAKTASKPAKEIAGVKQEPLQAEVKPNAEATKAVNSLATQPSKLSASMETKSKKPEVFKRSFSYSLVVAPDVSFVKLQATSNVGYSLGVMLRYDFAKRLSLEAGVLWSRKNYYTDGKYLDTNNLKLPMHSIVKTADGYCNMVDIPVNVRYSFITKPTYSWFISAGLSSYLMSSEAYDLSYERYSQPYEKEYGYSHSSKDWFSIMNLSAGYQTTLGKRTSFSIAPYVKLPLRGIGIGKLPVTSTGIYLTLSRSLK